MSDAERPNIHLVPDEPPSGPRRRLKKLRLLVVLVPLGVLAGVSTVFGMMMAVASDLPGLENEPQYRGAGPKNSLLYDSQGRPLGRLASDQHRVYVRYDQIAPIMREAVISVEDQRFETNNGVDLRGIGRAFTQDMLKKRATQGASTITQQFVKNALRAQGKRTIFEKLREAALAYHLTRKWGKKKILQEYLNSIYFGNGAYGIEAAAETYFGNDVNHRGCGTQKRPCAAELEPHEAALLAGLIQNPSGYDPVVHYQAAKNRRDVVLRKMLQQHYVDQVTYDQEVDQPLPAQSQIRPPSLNVRAPYFVSWIRQQLVDRYGAQRAFEGGLKIRTTIDRQLQDAAEQAVRNWLPPGNNGPTASLVAIDNDTGEVRAMVSGTKPYADAPFNLATQGQRQPGSAFKPFTLAEALEKGISPQSVWPSHKVQFCVVKHHGKCRESFVVNNIESTYVGQRTLENALTFSDNSVFATVGIKLGTKKIARLAERMGIRTPVSSNLAMTLGGLREGVTPLDMAHAYETFAEGGERTSGTLGAVDDGPVGISSVENKDGTTIAENHTRRARVLPPGVAKTATSVLSTVVAKGTGTKAAIGQFAAGKTGTTENYGDAWFVGFDKRLTVAVWVGYPDKLIPMRHDFQGGPVEGGTFPALVWHDFQTKANAVLNQYAQADRARALAKKGKTDTTTDTTTAPDTTPDVTPAPDASAGGETSTDATGGGADTGGGSDTTTGKTGGGTTGGDGGGQGTGAKNGGTGGTGATGGGTGGGNTPTPTPTPATPPATGDGTAGGSGEGTGGGAAAPSG